MKFHESCFFLECFNLLAPALSDVLEFSLLVAVDYRHLRTKSGPAGLWVVPLTTYRPANRRKFCKSAQISPGNLGKSSLKLAKVSLLPALSLQLQTKRHVVEELLESPWLGGSTTNI